MRIIILFFTAILIFQNICNAFQPTSFVGRSKTWSQASALKGRPGLSMSPAESEVATFGSNQLDTVASSATSSPVIQGLSPEANVAVFIIGIIPFLWATYEFWSRIAVGASFGTGKVFFLLLWFWIFAEKKAKKETRVTHVVFCTRALLLSWQSYASSLTTFWIHFDSFILLFRSG